MSIRLKNITNSSIALQMFHIDRPMVNFLERDPILLLEPGEDVDTHYWEVTNHSDPSYNEDLIDSYVNKGILTKVVVSSAPNIMVQPIPRTVEIPATYTFLVSASGTAPLIYQWRKNGVNINAANASSYTTPSTTLLDDNSMFDVVVSNSSGSVTSNAVMLQIITEPAITVQPAPLTRTAPATATFTVTATGHPTPTYQWKKDNVNVSTGTGGTTASYTTAPTVLGDDEAVFTVVITNAAGFVISDGAAILTVNTTPAFTLQPVDHTIVSGATTSFTVTATGHPTPTYLWEKSTDTGATWGATSGGSGSTTNTYTTGTLMFADTLTQYRCTITNVVTSVISTVGIITVGAD